MITVTAPAAKQIKISARQSNAESMALRIAAKKGLDGSIEYGMGFDEAKEDDMVFTMHDVTLIFAPEYGPLIKGMEIDYDELNPGEGDYHFIFLNPNDPNFVPPNPNATSCGSGTV
ncbi:iron-sulfur cluster assembly accessory protein [Ectothiorhodospiraceae bacterium BW-2]|nr:iron-sulfur cluster assembly accessory protein [Ectothiorhodospiraceae bacterium BW-2]